MLPSVSQKNVAVDWRLTSQGGQVFSGLGAGLNELIALAGMAERVPIAKRGNYLAALVFTILPFCPSALWAQLIVKDAGWRWNGLLVGIWNFVGLVLLLVFYRDPPTLIKKGDARKEVLRQVDYVGGFLSTVGILLFMLGMQWGAQQVRYSKLPSFEEVLMSVSIHGIVGMFLLL